jgi:hypothetical protein
VIISGFSYFLDLGPFSQRCEAFFKRVEALAIPGSANSAEAQILKNINQHAPQECSFDLTSSQNMEDFNH